MFKQKKFSGFTLVEVMTSVVVIIIFSTISIGIYKTWQERSSLNAMANNIVGALRRAQFLAKGSAQDSSWGVAINNGQLIIFKGLSFVGRENIYDEKISLANGVYFSGLEEVVFKKFSGEAQNIGTINLTTNNGQKQIIISPQNFNY